MEFGCGKGRRSSAAIGKSDLSQCGQPRDLQSCCMWQIIASAPVDRDIELAVIDRDGPHALVFPCRRVAGGWVNALSKERLDVRPTHWREWQPAVQKREISGR
jgi:hypothetical protein